MKRVEVKCEHISPIQNCNIWKTKYFAFKLYTDPFFKVWEIAKNKKLELTDPLNIAIYNEGENITNADVSKGEFLYRAFVDIAQKIFSVQYQITIME